MAVPFSNTKLRVPKGFQNILEGLAREILRNQPENMFEFGSKYFDQLLKVREETGHDPAVHGARLEDRFYNNDSFKSPSVDPSSPQQQDAALTIQTNYRKHAAEQEVAEMREAEAAEKIQAGFRGYQDRQKFAEMKDEEKKDTEEVDIDLNDPDVEKAAVKIQAGFKGFKARQEIKEAKESKEKAEPEAPKTEEEEVDIDLNDPEVENAALKIQAGFKGMKARQEIKEMKDSKKETTEAEQEQPEPEQQAEPEQSEEKQEEKAEEEVDIDLNDPETEKAALKIQAGFKGYQARKEIKAKKESSEQEAEKPPEEVEEKKEEEVDIDLNDPEVEKAATKIQAGFKGYKTRKELKDKTDDTEKQESGEGTAEEPSSNQEEEGTKEEPKTEG